MEVHTRTSKRSLAVVNLWLESLTLHGDSLVSSLRMLGHSQDDLGMLTLESGKSRSGSCPETNTEPAGEKIYLEYRGYQHAAFLLLCLVFG